MRILLPSMLLPLFCATAIAQAPGPEWNLALFGGTEPPLRRENPGATDGTQMYVFGGKSGNSGGAALNDLWSFDGTAWTMQNANGDPSAPPARDKAGITWDTARGKLIVYGGQDATGVVLGDIWEWDPGTNAWTDITPAAGSPPARRFTALAYDPATTGILMFGGLDSAGTHLNDTWLFLGGTAWVSMTTTTMPPVRRQHHLVTRPDVGDVLLFGGQDATLSPTSARGRRDVHSWNGADWTLIPTATDPEGVVANDATYDELRQRIVMVSGNINTSGGQFNGVSEFDTLTNDWVIRPGLGYFSRFFLAYIPALGKTYKVSGQGNLVPMSTYEYQSDPIATSTPFGAGCSGSSGPMTLTSNDAPWLGRTWNLDGAGFAATAIGSVVIGLGQQTIPLANLHPAGGTGCDLLVANYVTGLVFPSSGMASFGISLPNVPFFAGLPLNAQMISAEITGGTITLIASTNGLAGVAGAL